ncbi:MAG: hypothetical protein J6D12_01675 [Peptostreptococcaceae bacterium]|nr:hypothetical protein [Peptostreptococcaceae bacterium]
MENNYYIRIQGEKFGFVVDGVHDILADVDHAITQEEYDMFFKLQGEGKQFRVKYIPTGETLFDLIEEYTPEPIEMPVTVSLEERVEALEALMLEVI